MSRTQRGESEVRKVAASERADLTNTEDSIRTAAAGIEAGDRVRFEPDSHAKNWWRVRARNERFVVATRQAPFHPRGVLMYTVVDLVGWDFSRNGAGPGVVRGPLDILGGGWGDGRYDDECCAEILDAITNGSWDLSRRRSISVYGIKRDDAPETPQGGQS